jgi:general L-amino acid transport system substrate-binding protein
MRFEVRQGLRFLFIIAAAMACFASMAQALPGPLDSIRARGHVVCGVSADAKGYAVVDKQGAWSGIGVDFCRALAAAVLGN